MSTTEFIENGIRYKGLSYRGMPDYWVGDDGTYWNCIKGNWKQLKSASDNAGYQIINIKVENKWKGYKLHRLILDTFVGPCPEGMECRHLDGSKDNNRLDNLCWDTRKSNQNDRIKHGTSNRGEGNWASKLTQEIVRMIRTEYRNNKLTAKEIENKYKLSQSQVNKILTGKCWKYMDDITGTIPNQGSRIKWAKLKEDDVRKIKVDKHSSNSDLAKKYGVSTAAIRNIRIGRSWKCVS